MSFNILRVLCNINDQSRGGENFGAILGKMILLTTECDAVKF
jgi:hypothetical protein